MPPALLASPGERLSPGQLFRNGRNQAIRIPRAFALPGDHAIMRRCGDKLIIEAPRPRSLLAVLAELGPIAVSFPNIDDKAPTD